MKKDKKRETNKILVFAFVTLIAIVVLIFLTQNQQHYQYQNLERLQNAVWVKYPNNPILTPDPKSWDNYAVRDPFVLKKDEKYFMFYYGYGGKPPAIGLAISEDGFKFTRYGKKPILDLGKPGEWDSSLVQIGSIIKLNEKYLMYYNGARAVNGTYDFAGIGIAESTDLFNWTKYNGNPIWKTDKDLKYTAEYIPFVINKNGRYYMYCERATRNGWVIDMSISDDPYSFSNFTTVWIGARTLGIDNPKVYAINETTMLLGYNGFDVGNPGNLRLAISDNGIDWKPFNNGTLILEKINGSWDGYRMENAFLLFDKDDIKLYYFASPSEELKNKWKIGIATLKR